MSDDLATLETKQENDAHYGELIERVAKALDRHAPHAYDPASDDMTVEFAIDFANQDAVIERLRDALRKIADPLTLQIAGIGMEWALKMVKEMQSIARQALG